jgi:ParB-like chromosome segregation protein Spo0J
MKIIPKPILPTLPESEFKNLLDSIRLYGVKVPLLVADDGTLIDGHERLRACDQLGVKKYPHRVVGNLTEGERREMAVRINLERRHLSRAERQD